MERRRSAARRWLVRLLPLVLVAAALGLVTPPKADASCVGPMLGVGDASPGSKAARSAPTIQAGAPLVVTGTWFRTGCDDTGTGGCAPQRTSEKPMRNVKLKLEQGGHLWKLGTADADEGAPYAIRWEVAVPDGVRPGKAVLVTGEFTRLAVVVVG